MMSRSIPSQIKPLTGIRGLAALYVVAYHIPFLPWFNQSSFLRHGYLAVDLFFVLSGFVMAMSYSGMFAHNTSWRHYGAFLVRRLARVYPLYLLVTCIYGFAMMANVIDRNGLQIGWWPLIANVLMIQAWGFTASILSPLWSISAEWAAYLMFPIFAALFLFSRRRVTLLLCACAGVILVGLSLAPKSSPSDWRAGPLDISWVGSLLPVVRCLAEFSLGLAAFRAADRTDVQAVLGHWAFAPVASLCVIAFLMQPNSDVAVVALLPFLIISMAIGRGPVQSFLSWWPVLILGELSYAIYLLHPRLSTLWKPLAASLPRSIGTDAAWRISFVIVLMVCAGLAHALVEKPCRRGVRKLEAVFGLSEREAVLTSKATGKAKLS